MNLLSKYWKKIPERHYFPIFVFSSLFFVINELIVITLIVVYIVTEKQIRSATNKIVKFPEAILWASAIIFFLVMIDDTLLYLFIIAFVAFDTRRKNSRKKTHQDSLT